MKQIAKWAAMFIAAVAASAALPARASTFTVGGSGNTFTITRSDTNAAETVRCRAVSRSALAGLHFMGNIGRLDFAAGERSKSVQVSERTAAEINDPRFIYYLSGGATGSSRTYRFELIDDGGFALAYADRAISYDASKSVSSATFDEKSVTVTNGEITVKDTGFAQAYHAVPLANYFSSTMPEDYLASSGANLRMLFDLQAAEVDDGYQYIQILINQTSNCDMPKKGSDNGDPGTVQISRYMAGFEHKHGTKDTNFKKYTFPVVSTNDNFGATLPWSGQGNDVGNLCMQRFNTNCRAADGRLVVPAAISSLGIRFTASGDDDDDWTAKSVVAHIQAVPSAPSLIQNVNPIVTPAPVCKGSEVSVSLPFNEIVTVTGTPTLSTTWGNLAYVAGSGANVLTFAGPVTAAAGTALRITGLSGTVKGLTGTSFAWSGTTTVSGRTVDTLSAPPREGLVYQLSTSAHLLWFADRLAIAPNTSAALAADIDLSNVGDFVPMGGANGFLGTFDGRGHVLSGLSVSSPDSASPAAPTAANPARYGLFGQIAAQGVVSNLVLSGATVSATNNPALVGAVCGRNLGTIALCSVSGGEVSTGPRSAVAPGTALGGVCGENAGAVRACRVVGPLGSTGAVLYNRVKNDTVGGIAGTNAVSGTLESCYFHASFSNVENVNITRGAVCGSNAGAIRRCVGLHDNYNYFNGAVGSDVGTVEDTLFPDASAFSGGEVCYALNGGVTDGSQPWYQALGTDDLPLLVGPTVYLHGSEGYVNTIEHVWTVSFEHSPDYSNGTWTAVCSVGHETNVLNVAGTGAVTTEPTCTAPGQTTWTYVPPANDYGVTTTNVVQDGVPPALGHAWDAPAWSWNTDYTAATATFHCSRCDFDDTVSATVTRIVDGANIVSTATATHHGETFTATASVSATPWKALQVRLDLGGTVTLTNDVTATDLDATLTVTNTVTLDLHGHTIDADGRFRVIQVLEGGNLTLTNSIPESGAIIGGNASYGGGVYVDDGGTFEMTGGEISGNTASSDGGGVYMYDGGTFEMSGGEISGNSANYGGGVYVNNGGNFTMSGGAISGNSATYGGGVYVYWDGTFTVSGSPVVSGSTNSVGAANNVYLYSGHTIAVDGLSPGARIGVTTATTPTASAPVTFATGASADDAAYFFSDNPAFPVDAADGALRLRKIPTPWDRLQAQLDAGGTVMLTNDVTAIDFDTSLTITKVVTLDLNGHTIDAAKRFRVIGIGNGGDLTLTNSLVAGAVTGGGDHGVYVGSNAVFRLQCGAIAGNESNFAGGGVFVDQFGMFEMTGGSITNNSVSAGEISGGGVYVAKGGTFEMSGGEISDNTADDGGGVCVDAGGTFEMTGGEISGNTADDGGGVYVYYNGTFEMSGGEISGNTADGDGGGGVYVNGGGTFTMTGGEISGNSATSGGGVCVFFGGTLEMIGGEISGNSATSGGGVCVYFAGTFEMTGGAISGNTAYSGGGVYMDGTFTVSGSPVVSGSTNSVGAVNNAYLASGCTIAVNGLSDGARIGVTTETAPTATAPVTFATGASARDSVYFFSDDPGFVVYRVNDALRFRPATSWDLLQAQLDAGGTVTLTNDVAAIDLDATLTITNAVTLDLNGHTIDAQGKFRVINVSNGGNLTLTNSIPASGAITGGNASNGGGVYVDYGGTFEMTGGEISDNTADDDGGGVYVNNGGGVYVTGGGTFTMTGGEISGNTAGDDGGGVYVYDGGTFTVSGSPVVSGSTNSVGAVNNVYLYSGRTIAVDGLSPGARIGVTTATAPTASAPVTFATGASADDKAYFFSDNPAFPVDAADGALRLRKIPTPWDLLQAQLDAGGTVTLTNDVTAIALDATLTVTNAVTLDLNGHTLTHNGNRQALSVGSGGDLTLTNSLAAGTVTGGGDHGVYVGSNAVFRLQGGAIAGNESNFAGGGVFVDQFGMFKMTGGSITNNSVSAGEISGGGVYVAKGGTFEMSGGEISDNTADDGGGVCVYYNGTFTMTGGEISSNTADGDGGGGVYVFNGGMFTMSGGEISGNSATFGGGVCVFFGGTLEMIGGEISGNSATFGGGVCVYFAGTFEMTGGAISGNTAYSGGGVYMDGTFTVSGSPVVSGSTNSVGAANNVYLYSGRTIAVNGLSSGARIGVTTASAPVTFATGASAGDDAYFFSDNPGFVVDCVDNALRLRPPTSWVQLQAQLDAGGTVTLMNDVTAADGDASLTVTNAVTLDLKGHTIDAQGKFRVVDVSNGGNLTLTNSVPESGAITGGNASNGGGVHVARGGTFTLSGGAISGNTADYGGGVYVYSGGTFEMAGGEISGDTANRDGGGVYMTGGTFEMTGGAISGNTASYGGGVEVYGGTFKMTGGEISGNTADSGGGGVDVVGGTFEMTGGAISGNTADDGGGVYVYGTFTVSGVSVVSGSTNSVGAANNVYLPAARTIAVNGLSPGARIGVTTASAPTATAPVTFTAGASAGDSVYFFSDRPSVFVREANGEVILSTTPPTPWERLQAQLDAGGTVTLTNDVAAADGDASLTVTNAVTLDLNGHVLTHNGNGQALSVGSGGDLTLTNSLAAGAVTGGGDHGVYVGSNAVFRLQGGAIAGNESSYAGGGVFVDQFGTFEMSGGSITNNAVTGGSNSGGGVYVGGGTFEMTGGEISGNTAAWYGGGVYVDNRGTFEMTGGAISGNTARGGGGVYVEYGGTFEMTGGAISGNTASSSRGGGVEVASGGTFEMTGGAISGNTAKSYGGGVYVTDTFTMTGGAISGNTAGDDGGGVYVYGRFTVSGSPVVSGSTNSVGAANNVYLYSGCTIAVNGLSDGARIGVTTKTAPTASAPVTFTAGAAAGDSVYFFSDRPSVFVREANGEMVLSTTPPTPWERLQYRLDAGGTVTLTNDVTATDLDATLTVTNAVTLDLNGHTLTHNGSGQVLSVGSGGNLTLTNSLAAGAVTGGGDHGVYVGSNAVFRLQGGAIAGNASDYAGGGVFVDQFGMFEMTGGSITNNAVTGGIEDGGGVCVANGGTFTMTGGEISGNTATYGGGGVYVTRGGTFEMTGGEISGNTANAYGGGVFVVGTFEMSGGEISGNTASSGGGVCVYGMFKLSGGEISGNTASSGGGVCVYGTFKLSGGEISGNTAKNYGGGVYNFDGTFAVSGNPVVSGSTNSVGTADNVYLYAGRTITVNGLSSGARIGVTTKTTPTASAPVTFATGVAASDEAYFFSDNSGFHMERDGNKMRLVEGMPEGFRDPQGVEIVDPAVFEWLSGNGFTQADIYALGRDSAGTEKLYEYYMLNCDFRVQDAGATISLTDITVSNDVVSVTVQLTRKAPFGAIKGCLYFYAAHDLADGFDSSPIVDTSVSFGADDPTFATAPTADSVTQTATATFSYISYKFFKAAIHAYLPDNGEEP